MDTKNDPPADELEEGMARAMRAADCSEEDVERAREEWRADVTGRSRQILSVSSGGTAELELDGRRFLVVGDDGIAAARVALNSERKQVLIIDDLQPMSEKTPQEREAIERFLDSQRRGADANRRAWFGDKDPARAYKDAREYEAAFDAALRDDNQREPSPHLPDAVQVDAVKVDPVPFRFTDEGKVYYGTDPAAVRRRVAEVVGELGPTMNRKQRRKLERETMKELARSSRKPKP